MIIDKELLDDKRIPPTLEGDVFLRFEFDENGESIGVHSCPIETIEQWRTLDAQERAAAGVDKYNAIIDGATGSVIAAAKQRRNEIFARKQNIGA